MIILRSIINTIHIYMGYFSSNSRIYGECFKVDIFSVVFSVEFEIPMDTIPPNEPRL